MVQQRLHRRPLWTGPAAHLLQRRLPAWGPERAGQGPHAADARAAGAAVVGEAEAGAAAESVGTDSATRTAPMDHPDDPGRARYQACAAKGRALCAYSRDLRAQSQALKEQRRQLTAALARQRARCATVAHRLQARGEDAEPG